MAKLLFVTGIPESEHRVRFSGIPLHAGWKAGRPCRVSRGLKHLVMYYDDNDYFEREETYERYNGSYAQDVEGWSDQDIDDVFDGDPEAYWNID